MSNPNFLAPADSMGSFRFVAWGAGLGEEALNPS